jgi:hypothetical protein
MPYTDGVWGLKAKERFQKRKESGYWRERYFKKHPDSFYVNSEKCSLGKSGEVEAQCLFNGSKMVRKNGQADLDFYGKKIEVKTSSLLKRKERPNSKAGHWKFFVKTQHGSDK